MLNEFTNVALRKFNRSWDETAHAVATIRMRFPYIVPLTTETHAAALALTRTHNFSFYDALIVAAALISECDVFMSEDMHNRQRIGPLRVINPLATGAG